MTMRAWEKNEALRDRLEKLTGSIVRLSDAEALRRDALRLHRWHEYECGTVGANPDFTIAIERDENTNKPFKRIMGPGFGGQWLDYRVPTPDHERAALRRIADICGRYGLHYYIQGDPRGAPLYIDAQPLTMSDYNRAAICVTSR